MNRHPEDSTTWQWLTDGDWDERVAASPGATPFHSRAWGQAMVVRDPRFRARALGTRLADGTSVVLPLLARRGLLRRGLLGRAVSTLPGTYGGPVAAGRLLAEDDWEELLARLERSPLGRLDCFGNVQDPIPPRLARGREASTWETHVLELDELPAEPDRAYPCARAIRKARRSGVRVERTTERGALDEYLAVYRSSLERWGKEPARGYPRELFEHLLASPVSELWLARDGEGRLAAGGVFLFAPLHCVYWQGAMDRDLADARPMNLLMHELVLEARRRGCARFDFNPSGSLEGVRRFKESFAARPVSFETWRHRHPLLARLRKPGS